MRKIVLFSALSVLSAMGTVASAEEIGRVISSTPVIQQVAVPRQVCNVQQVLQPAPSGGGAVLGAIVGGLLGNQIGHGMGRAAATGIGAVAGAGVGNSLEARGQPQAVQQCTTENTYENRAVGYNVIYEYAGKQFSVQMPYDPGPSIRLQVTPVAGSVAPSQGSNVVTAPAIEQSAVGQPIAQVIAVPTAAAYPAYYPAYPAYYPAYYGYPYYPPVSLSLGFGFFGGGGGFHHHGGGHRWH
jgi:uncharacterized protein YcfJ